MSDFDDTELAIIALVLGQNAEQYGDRDDTRRVKSIATKARKQMSTNE